VKLLPLRQFYCDTCGGVINDRCDGILEWDSKKENDFLAHDFKIVHKRHVSPLCDIGLPCWEDLYRLLYNKNISTDILLDILIRGVADIFEWQLVFRRLTVPYYCEALHLCKNMDGHDIQEINTCEDLRMWILNNK
jgi:hypothetical protein